MFCPMGVARWGGTQLPQLGDPSHFLPPWKLLPIAAASSEGQAMVRRSGEKEKKRKEKKKISNR